MNFLVEKPEVIIAEFNGSFLKLPEVIIVTEMKEHQKYFPMRDKKGRLVNQFLIVANIHDPDRETLQNIRLGNQRVLASRLEDGAFSFQKDRKNPSLNM